MHSKFVRLRQLTSLPDGENSHLKFRLRKQTREEKKHFKRPVLQSVDKHRSIKLGIEKYQVYYNT